MALTKGTAPRANDAKLNDLDLQRVVISYDRASDTLMVHLFGRGRAAVSVPSPRPLTRDFVFLRIDPETDELVGVQIEDFLRLYVVDHPEMLHLLERAELRGITHEEVNRIQDRFGRDARRPPVAVDALIREVLLAT